MTDTQLIQENIQLRGRLEQVRSLMAQVCLTLKNRDSFSRHSGLEIFSHFIKAMDDLNTEIINESDKDDTFKDHLYGECEPHECNHCFSGDEKDRGSCASPLDRMPQKETAT